MARRFDGVDDLITFGSGASIDNFTTITYSIWFYLDAFTTAAGMRPCGKRKSINAKGVTAANDNCIEFFAPFTGDDGSWDSPNNSVSTGVWTHVGLTYDGALTTNDPIIYLGGTSQTISETVTPTGTLELDEASDFVVGNNATPGVRPWDGALAEVGYWNRILTAAEIGILADAYSPLFIPNGLELYSPLIGNNSPESNPMGSGTGTITGATKDSHPRIIYPSSGQMRRFTTAAVGGAAAQGAWKSLLGVGI